jgi:hypothetical protein
MFVRVQGSKVRFAGDTAATALFVGTIGATVEISGFVGNSGLALEVPVFVISREVLNESRTVVRPKVPAIRLA